MWEAASGTTDPYCPDHVQMDENQGSQPSEAGVEEILERLQQLLQGWSRPEKQVGFL